MEVAHLATQELSVSPEPLLDVKEQVRQAVDIVELVGNVVQLRRQGRNYVGLCPWHDDSRPSLQVNPERQSFKCWVCDIGGDIFSFVMKMEGVEFPEALSMLADRAGISMVPRQKRSPSAQPDGQDAGDKRTLYQAMAWAEEQYHNCLMSSPEAELARKYLSERKIPSEIARKFRIGFSPNRWDWIIKQSENGPFSSKVLETIGLLGRRDEGRVYDRFKGRVLFSIRDSQGRPVGLGGRVLPELGATSPAKYVNSPETPIFSKSRLLYGLDTAREAIRKSRTVLVTEGYTDCIAAHQYGFENTVAVLGTALGDSHIQILKRFADQIVLVLDGDEAGKRRANEVLEMFVAQQVDLRILTLPENSDPCDFLQSQGSEAFAKLLENQTVDALTHAFIVETVGVDLQKDVHGATNALERLVSIVAKSPRPAGQDRFREEKVLNRLARDFRVPEEQVRSRLAELRRQSRNSRMLQPTVARHQRGADRSSAKIEPWQRELLEVLVQNSNLAPIAMKEFSPDQLNPGPGQIIFETICRLSTAGAEPTFERLMLEFDDAAMKSLLVELDESERIKRLDGPETLLQELIDSHKRLELEKRHPTEIAALRDEGLDRSQKTDQLRQLMEELRSHHGISDPTDG